MLQISEVQSPLSPANPYLLAFIGKSWGHEKFQSHLFPLFCKKRKAVWQVLGDQLWKQYIGRESGEQRGYWVLQGTQEQKLYLIWVWWSSQMLSGGVVMSVSGTPVCSNPSLTKPPRTWRLGRTSQSFLNTYSQQPRGADLLNYFISLVLLAAATWCSGIRHWLEL